jgi:hypothetical protein
LSPTSQLALLAKPVAAKHFLVINHTFIPRYTIFNIPSLASLTRIQSEVGMCILIRTAALLRTCMYTLKAEKKTENATCMRLKAFRIGLGISLQL